MSKLNLILGSHNHVPEGSGDENFERAYQSSFKPFLTVFYSYPEIPLVLHYSGTLLNWLEKNHPEFIMLMNEMVGRKQVELLGGGFYEPILSLISSTDRLGQVELLTTYLRKRFGKRPRGVWLAEKAWENSLAASLQGCGMDYTFLDDNHFLAGGIDAKGLKLACITEDQGKSLVVFPLLSNAETRILDMDPSTGLDRLIEAEDTPESVISIILDGSIMAKPEISGRLFAGKWLDSFLKALSNSSDGLHPLLPGHFLRGDPILQKGYFPSFASERMMRCSLTPGNRKRYDELLRSCKDTAVGATFVRGGGVRQFFIRYRESALLYAKMQYVHILVNQLRGDKYRKQTALDELWKGQCGDVYWHGDSDGIYRNEMRKSAYRALIESEKITREKGNFIPSIIPVDFDLDGLKEYLFQGPEVNAYVHSRGGMLFELDYLPSSWNYLDTMSRYPESYHSAEAKDSGYDRYSRKAFIDHFWSPQAERKSVVSGKEEERGGFYNAVYQALDLNRSHHELTLACDSKVVARGREIPVRLIKRFLFKKNTITVHYSITNIGGDRLQTLFAPEINLSLSSDRLDFVKTAVPVVVPEPANPDRALENVSEVLIDDEANETQIRLTSEKPTDVWAFTVSTYSRMADAEVRTYQSSCLVPRWRVDLAPQGTWENRVTLQIG